MTKKLSGYKLTGNTSERCKLLGTFIRSMGGSIADDKIDDEIAAMDLDAILGSPLCEVDPMGWTGTGVT
jgi:hypothetical protein